MAVKVNFLNLFSGIRAKNSGPFTLLLPFGTNWDKARSRKLGMRGFGMTLNKPGLTRAAGRRFLAALIFLLFPIALLQAAEKPNLMERWLVNDQLSGRAVDHSPWQNLLGAYLVARDEGESAFNYAAVTDQDQEVLSQYIIMLGRTDVDRLNRDEQMAFWINAYNALVVSIVLEDYPVRSINDIGGWFFSPGPWKEKRFRVYLINLSLNDIHHRILRPIWEDLRIHYVLSCGARGCPALAAKPFTGKSIEEDLAAAETTFINHGPAIRQIRGTGVTLSRIYDWYGRDFGEQEEQILAHIKNRARGDLAVQLAPVGKISSYGFDWDLNDAAGQTSDN